MKLFLFLLKNDKKKFKFSLPKASDGKRERNKEKEDGKKVWDFLLINFFEYNNLLFYFNFNLKSRLMDLMEQFENEIYSWYCFKTVSRTTNRQLNTQKRFKALLLSESFLFRL